MNKYKEIQTLLHEMYEQGKFDAIAELQMKGKAIVSKQIWDEHIVNWETNVEILRQTRKETVKEILQEVGKVCGDYQWFKNLCKKYGVEVYE